MSDAHTGKPSSRNRPATPLLVTMTSTSMAEERPSEVTRYTLTTKLAYSVEEAAWQANIGRDGIYQAIRQKRLDAKKVGRRTLIPADALRRFIENLPPLRLPSAA